MTPLSGPALCRALERHGWSLLRTNGSHHIYGKPGEAARLSVPCHGAKPLKLGLFRALLKAASLTEADL